MGTPLLARKKKFWVDWSCLRSPIPLYGGPCLRFPGTRKKCWLARVEDAIGVPNRESREVAERAGLARTQVTPGNDTREVFSQGLQCLPDAGCLEEAISLGIRREDVIEGN